VYYLYLAQSTDGWLSLYNRISMDSRLCTAS